MKFILPLVAFATCAYANSFEAALEQAGANKAELQKAIRTAPAEQQSGLKFLITYMPERDLKSLKADFLLSHLTAAYQAKNTYPWAKKLSDEVFFNDVLPYASLNERRDDWRTDFHKRFSKYVKHTNNSTDAVKAITSNIASEVKVKYSTKRKKADQSPYESMEQGLASCTGLSILLVDACRSVGIPARIVGTPSWTTKQGNHNWVEVYLAETKEWKATDYYPDAKGFDSGWHIADAAQQNPNSLYHRIYASSWKKTNLYFPLVWAPKLKYVPAINVTQRYIDLVEPVPADKANCELRLAVYNAKGERVNTTVQIVQGTDPIGNGQSPKAIDDMNKFLNIKVKRGQLFHAVWIDPDTKKQRYQQIKSPKDKAWLEINLGDKKDK